MSDKLLIAQCRQNNRKAQLRLYDTYCKGMLAVAYRYLRNDDEAEDAVQESFIKAFRKLDQFTGQVTFGAWLKKIVVHTCLDKIKAQKASLVSLEEETLHVVNDDDSAWDIPEGVVVEEVRNAIENLPEKYRSVTLLYLLEGYDHNEIATITDITPNASRTLVHRARKMMQKELKHLYDGTEY